MNSPYPYLSEALRTTCWSMHAGFFDYYRRMITESRFDGKIDLEKLEAERVHPYLLIYHKDASEPEERLILTSNTQWWNEEYLKKDDQIINVIPLNGPILSGGGPCSYGTAELADRFVYADSRPSVIGHFVIINTPGGSAYANELNDLFENAKKPVVGLIRGMCCSKGVEIASHIPHVFSESRNADIGCIGTMARFEGIKSGTEQDGIVFYSVYADDSPKKNYAYREAIEKGNLEPVKQELNEINDQFLANVKKRWPSVSQDVLTGDTYKAHEVEGQLFDGYKSYGEAIDYIFELAGKKRLEPGTVTPVGIVHPVEDDLSTGQTTSSEIINSPKKLAPMTNIEALEAILGKGTVQVDENGKVQLTSEQIVKLNEHYASLNNDAEQSSSLVATQAETIANQAAIIAEKDKKIRELAEATSRGINQPAPENDSATEQHGPKVVETALEGITDPVEKLKIVTSVAKNAGLL
ncbi:S49 family peptidase [Parabacteroides goldsteinii]|uniref:S49 family peptidase n=1 Tax=Parabacteroides goldsteinii TaxID=328812 RepID=UPI00267641DD|nr:S49 family peptidase [Parabacteroides goldsteinii]